MDATTHEILGPTMLGPDAGEVLAASRPRCSAACLAALRDAVPTHLMMAAGLNVLLANGFT